MPPEIVFSGPTPAVTAGTDVTYHLDYIGADQVNLSTNDITLFTTDTADAADIQISDSGPTSRIVTLSGIQGNGTLNIEIAEGTGQDNSGNLTPSVIGSPAVVDTVAPTLEVTGPEPVLANNDATVVYTLLYDDNNPDTLMINLDVLAVTLVPAQEATTTGDISIHETASPLIWEVHVTNIQGDGDALLEIAAGTASDGATSTPEVVTEIFTADNTAPGAPEVSGTSPTNNSLPTWSWTSGGGGNGAYRHAFSDDEETTWTETTDEAYTPASSLADGSYTLYVQERDDAGNWSTSGSLEITIDATPPGIDITGPDPASTNYGPVTYTLNITDATGILDAAAINIQLQSTGTATAGNVAVSGTDATRTVTLSNISGDGTLAITVPRGIAWDALANMSVETVSDAVTVTAPYPIIQITPSEEYDFSKVHLGDCESATFVIKNIGTALLEGTASVPTGMFSIQAGTADYSLQPGEQDGIILLYCPTTEGDHESEVQFSGAQEISVPCSGTGICHLGDYQFNVARDYNQARVVTITNKDDVTREFMVELADAQPADLAINFVGLGSPDSGYVTLEPNASLDVRLMIHAQDATPDVAYNLEARLHTRLDANEETFDSAIDITVDAPDIALSITQIAQAPNSLAVTLLVENTGTDVITDLNVSADDTLEPFVLFEPNVNHGRLAPGASITLRAIPDLYYLASNPEALNTGFIYADAMDVQEEAEVQFSCLTGDLYASTLTAPMIEATMQDLDCTSPGTVTTSFILPSGFDSEAIEKADLSIRFEARSGYTHTEHDTSISLNNVEIATIADTVLDGFFEFSLPAETLAIPTSGIARNEIQIEVSGNNAGHCTLVTECRVTILLDTVETILCASSQEEANELVDLLGYYKSQPASWDISDAMLIRETTESPVEDCGSVYIGETYLVEVTTVEEEQVLYMIAQPEGEPAFRLNWIEPGLYRGQWTPTSLNTIYINVFAGICHNDTVKLCVTPVEGTPVISFTGEPVVDDAPLATPVYESLHKCTVRGNLVVGLWR